MGAPPQAFHDTDAYDAGYYDALVAGSLRSARVVLPHVLELVAPRSVLDVGCGTGAWASVCAELGVEDVMGVDGGEMDPAQLLLAPGRFAPVDLEGPVDLGRRFDLVVSLEVGEHLPAWAAPGYVATLAAHADVVLFSAAIPGQGGLHHVNEQWPEYWAHRFAREGYRVADPLRALVWHDRDVETWYAQNLLLFVREDRLEAFPALAAHVKAPGAPLAVVHPRLYDVHRPWMADPACADPAAPPAPGQPDDPDDLDVVVVSAGRPAQLERVLRSARGSRAWDTAAWTVVHAAADPVTAAAYARVGELHPGVARVDLADHPGADPRDVVLARLGGRARVALLDDDACFDDGAANPLRPLPRPVALPALRRDGLGALLAHPADPTGAERLLAGERLALDGPGWEAQPANRGALVCVAHVAEVLARPDLLSAYAAAVTGADDATLVLHAPGADADRVAAELGPLLARAGLDAPGAADLELLCAPEPGASRALSATAVAVLSRRAPRAGLAGLVHLDPADAGRLRRVVGLVAEEQGPATAARPPD